MAPGAQTQQLFHEAENTVEKDWMEVAADIQLEIAKDFAPLAGVRIKARE